jgi:5-methylcytosine-specific restriction endonuclease McrA
MAKEWAMPLYKSTAWKALRLRALMRDGYTCRMCGARATEVDHIRELTPENIRDVSISLNLDNLQSLCHDCHTRKTKEDKGLISFDCDVDYYFDENGELIKRDQIFS